ncbi:cobalt-precorrin-6A reductase [Roseospira marina]|uniref:Cobalt-precorrin-6A reductase n=1 Tax=Roseospira marina TaxID=140057 RepID=A0A5M6IBX8_9PROT|nr:cobalt-precorrin-6A reductase [Roseospira marina]KAA5605245.1 cobalt-precorrin-6A reductase [Roseospira marina]MBB4314704.1 precorrin-6A/cobalt-precorrin-6A reductase [Roseospira marina]MBB5087693.1 precorrin-6A/cobalt-precorrin-6A reductase [Roseospira marina]
MTAPRLPFDRPSADRRRILVLGGTTEGYALAEALVAADRWDPVSSLAGRTATPRPPAGTLRVGGFGGPEGLARYLTAEGIAAVIDATHPFASRMGWNAATACAATGVPLLRLERPRWVPGDGDAWTLVPDWEAAVTALRTLGARRVLLAIGRQEVAPFAGLEAVWMLIRSVQAPDPMPPFAQAEVLLARGPFTQEDEAALLRDRRIDTIVCKNSGGVTDAKLAAARSLGVRVVMRDRPTRPDTATAATVAEALAWVARSETA